MTGGAWKCRPEATQGSRMIDARTGIRLAALALAAAATPVEAVPPPVEVTPLVIAADAQGDVQRAATELVHDLGQAGHFAAEPPPPILASANCRLDDPERERCFAEAARDAPVSHAVFVLAEPAGARVR